MPPIANLIQRTLWTVSAWTDDLALDRLGGGPPRRDQRGAPADGLVWPGRGGGLSAANTPTGIVERAQCRCGLVDPSGRPLATLQQLRHTAGSIALAAGVPLIAVSRQLGHANPNVTASVYSHLLSDSQLDDVAAVFEVAPVAEHEAIEVARAADR